MQEVIDLVFSPVVSVLQQAVAWLSSARLMAFRGININHYLGYVAWLGPTWLGVVQTTITCAYLVALVHVSLAAWGLYLRLKAGVKWW